MDDEVKIEGRINPEGQLRAVRAKMKCHAVETSKWAPTQATHKVKLGAVCGQEGENASFTKYTPSGECWMQIDAKAPALEFFEPGVEYYVTFTKAPTKETLDAERSGA